jgi:APA family basic amino acid/polyamine antiporter
MTAYFSFAGVYIIAEVAGEVENPGRSIPLAILLSFAVIILVYTLVPLALTRILPWQTLDTVPMAVVTAAQTFLPVWVVTFIAACALLAAVTSINGMLMGLSRDFYSGARSGLFPAYFAVVHSRFRTPGRAVVTVGLLALVGVFTGGGILQYAQIAVMGLMLIQVMTGLALLRLPTKLPQAYEASSFKLGRNSLRFVSWAYIIVSIAFFLLLATEQPAILLPGGLFVLLGLGFYAISRRRGA